MLLAQKVFFACALKISNDVIHLSLRNDKLNAKNNTFSWSESFVFLFFVEENNNLMIKIYWKEMYSFKLFILI